MIISGEAGRTMIISNILQKYLSAIWNMDSCLALPIPAQCAVLLTTCCGGLAPVTPLSISIISRRFDDAYDAVTQIAML